MDKKTPRKLSGKSRLCKELSREHQSMLFLPQRNRLRIVKRAANLACSKPRAGRGQHPAELGLSVRSNQEKKSEHTDPRHNSNMIDVYDMIPQENGIAGGDGLYNPVPMPEPSVAGVERYQSLLAKLSVQDEFTVAHIDWGTPVEEDVPVGLMHQRGSITAVTPIKLESGGDALVATFSDAAAAMR